MSNVYRLGNKAYNMVDVFGNGRTAFELKSSAEFREGLDLWADDMCDFLGLSKTGDLEDLRENPIIHLKPDGANIRLLENNSRYGFLYDCKKWALDNAGLHYYTEDGNIGHALVSKNFSDIVWIPEPREGAIVMYSYEKSPAQHWGIVSEVSDDIYIDSKWGQGHVYNHVLDCVSGWHGEYASFFRKVDS